MPLAYIQFIEKPDWEGPPGRPDIGLPEHPNRPGQRPPNPDRPHPEPPDIDELPGQPLPPGQLPSLPAPPGDLSGKVVVLIWKPGVGWSGKVLDQPSKPDLKPPAGGIGGRPPERPQPQPPHHPDQGGPTPEPSPKPGYPEEQARWNR